MLLLKALGGLAMAATIVSAETHTINVGSAGGHSFDPEETEAMMGDVIRFQFYPHLHSVARAAYEQACQPIEKSNPMTDEVSFFSGFVPVKDQVGVVGATYEVSVNTTDPIWVYCSQQGSCVQHNMTAVIWVNGNKTDYKGNKLSLDKHKASTQKFLSSGEISPGQQMSSEGKPLPMPGFAGTPLAPASKEGLSKGAIAGIAIGAVVGVALIALAVYLFGRNKTLSETLRYSRPPPGKVAPLPAMSEGPTSPYPPPSFPASPAFPGETKMASAMVTPAPGYNHQDNNQNAHQSWMSASTTMRAQSPDSMHERGYQNGGMMSPNVFSPHNSYMQQQQQQQQPMQQQNSGSYHMQSSPSETPWSPGGYNWQNVQPQHEMGAGQEGVAMSRQSQIQNNGYPTPSHIAAPVELAGDTSDNVVSAAPPVYRPPADGETVQKPEDKTPAVTTRDA